MTFPDAEEPTRTQAAPHPKRRASVRPMMHPTRIRTRKHRPKDSKVVGPRAGSKAAKVLSLLKRPQGASLKDLLKATGWQPHSVRGFLSGTVAGKLGLKLLSSKTESGERRYAVRA